MTLLGRSKSDFPQQADSIGFCEPFGGRCKWKCEMNLKWSCVGERCGQKCNEKVELKWAALTAEERNIKWWNGMTNYVWEVSLPCVGKPKTPLQKKKRAPLNLSKLKRDEPISLCFTLVCFYRLVMLQCVLSVSAFLSTFLLSPAQRWQNRKSTSVVNHTCCYYQCL